MKGSNIMEQLYRAMRQSDDKWLYGLYLDERVYNTDYPCIVPLKTIANDGDWKVKKNTVSQWIGLTDKNGQKIFEGDIVKDVQSNYLYQIKWYEQYACFALGNYKGIIEIDRDIEEYISDLQVIGNIWDNPAELNYYENLYKDINN